MAVWAVALESEFAGGAGITRHGPVDMASPGLGTPSLGGSWLHQRAAAYLAARAQAFQHRGVTRTWLLGVPGGGGSEGGGLGGGGSWRGPPRVRGCSRSPEPVPPPIRAEPPVVLGLLLMSHLEQCGGRDPGGRRSKLEASATPLLALPWARPTEQL